MNASSPVLKGKAFLNQFPFSHLQYGPSWSLLSSLHSNLCSFSLLSPSPLSFKHAIESSGEKGERDEERNSFYFHKMRKNDILSFFLFFYCFLLQMAAGSRGKAHVSVDGRDRWGKKCTVFLALFPFLLSSLFTFLFFSSLLSLLSFSSLFALLFLSFFSSSLFFLFHFSFPFSLSFFLCSSNDQFFLFSTCCRLEIQEGDVVQVQTSPW